MKDEKGKQEYPPGSWNGQINIRKVNRLNFSFLLLPNPDLAIGHTAQEILGADLTLKKVTFQCCGFAALVLWAGLMILNLQNAF